MGTSFQARLLLLSLFISTSLCSTADRYPDQPRSLEVERQITRPRSTRTSSIDVAISRQRNDGAERLDNNSEGRHSLQRRGSCISKSGCRSTKTQGTTRSSPVHPNSATPPNTPSTGGQAVPLQRSLGVNGNHHSVNPLAVVPGPGGVEPQRSASLTAESRDNVGPLSRTDTAGRDNLSYPSTPGTSRPNSARSQRQSTTSGRSHADSIGVLYGDGFIPADRRRRQTRPNSAGTVVSGTFKGQQVQRPASAESVRLKGVDAVSEKSHGSRRSFTVSEGSALARWWMK